MASSSSAGCSAFSISSAMTPSSKSQRKTMQERKIEVSEVAPSEAKKTMRGEVSSSEAAVIERCWE